jgi:mannonate dehydratase
MDRRNILKGFLAAPALAAAQQQFYEDRTKGLPPLKIQEVKAISTAAGGRYRWLFVKIVTNEPGIYGIGSANNHYRAFAVREFAEKHLPQFLIGKDPDRIEDIWQSLNVAGYWRNGTIHTNILSAVDEALWDIKGKRAGMPVYDLLGGKARDAVPLYAHAGGRSFENAIENTKKYMDEGYRHVRVQLGAYGGGGFIPPGQGSRPRDGYDGEAFDDEMYVDTIPKLFEQVRVKLGNEVKLLHDVHEHLKPTMAVEFAKLMEPYRMFFVEDILPPEHISWFRNIRQVTSTPMAMGELFTTPLEYVPLISERLIDFVRCRVSQNGGITQAKKIATLCEFFGVQTAWQEGGENDPVNQLASYHVDLSISSFGIQEENHFPDLVHEMMPGTAQQIRGYLYGSGKPGLGIDINEDMAAKYPWQVSPTGDNWKTPRAMDGSVVKP